MFFKNFLELVTAPQVAIDATDMALLQGELDDWTGEHLSEWINDIIAFHFDMLMMSFEK